MPDYIDDEKILDCTDLLIADDGMGYFVFTGDDIENIPAADVAPIVHGAWIYDHATGEPFCSECGRDAVNGEITPFCPHCGAKMEGEK